MNISSDIISQKSTNLFRFVIIPGEACRDPNIFNSLIKTETIKALSGFLDKSPYKYIIKLAMNIYRGENELNTNPKTPIPIKSKNSKMKDSKKDFNTKYPLYNSISEKVLNQQSQLKVKNLFTRKKNQEVRLYLIYLGCKLYKYGIVHNSLDSQQFKKGLKTTKNLLSKKLKSLQIKI